MIRRVIRYSGLDYYAALELDCDVFLLMNKNAIVEELQQSEAGRAYLEKCERLQVTEPD